jgi:pyruvate/2-oxoglutarate dehydrogenase complex dihydrolipoamide acyltransferase (E2) component
VVDRGQVVVRPILPVPATFDHRVIDGYQAAKLGRTFKELLEAPARLLSCSPAR